MQQYSSGMQLFQGSFSSMFPHTRPAVPDYRRQHPDPPGDSVNVARAGGGSAGAFSVYRIFKVYALVRVRGAKL